MRVLHVTRDYPPRNHGGLSSAVEGWARALRAAGGEAAVVSFDAHRPRRGQAARTWSDPGAPRVLRVEGPPDEAALLAFARAQQPDVVHLHDGLLLSPARLLRSALGRPLVVSVHVLQHHLLTLRGLTTATLSAQAEREAVAAADLLTAPSPSALARLEQDHPSLRAPRRVLPLVVQTSAGRPPDPLRAAPPTVLFAGRLADVKGATDVLAAAPLVARSRPDIHFELAGGLPASPRAERRFVRRHLEPAAGALPGRVSWLGWCDADALDAAYRRAHLLVAPSWSETFGQCVFEALARATPVVTSDVGAFGDYLEPGRECLQVPPREPEALAGAVLALLGDEGRRQALGAHGPATSAAFGRDRVGEALRETYAAAAV